MPGRQFPFEAFRDIGYKYIAVNGMKAYNGVALISRVPFESELALDWTERSVRHISGVFPGNIEIHNFYIPAGGISKILRETINLLTNSISSVK